MSDYLFERPAVSMPPDDEHDEAQYESCAEPCEGACGNPCPVEQSRLAGG